jgi:hypothetical protein
LQVQFGCRSLVCAKRKRVASPLIFNDGILVDVSTISFLDRQIFSTNKFCRFLLSVANWTDFDKQNSLTSIEHS